MSGYLGLDGKRFPTLVRMLYDGTVWIEGRAFIGMASDGKAVQVGDDSCLEDTERFVRDCPREEW